MMIEETKWPKRNIIDVPRADLAFGSGILGIDNNLYVWDGDSCVATPTELTPKSRRALAAEAIELWTRFAKY